MSPRKQKKTQRAPANEKECDICGKSFSLRGLSTHRKACLRHREERQNGAKIRSEVLEDLRQSDPRSSQIRFLDAIRQYVPGPSNSQMATPTTHNTDNMAGIHDIAAVEQSPDRNSASPPPQPPPFDIDGTAPEPDANDRKLDDIKTEYHPNSGRPTRIDRFESYRRNIPSTFPKPPPDKEPWKPFKSRFDFEFAEFALEAALNEHQIDVLISLFRRCEGEHEALTITNFAELCRIWDFASTLVTSFEKSTIHVAYTKNDIRTYDVWHRSVWEWGLDVLRDPIIGPHIHWDAERLYKHNGNAFERFIHEPWTADRWWDIQSELPKDAKPLCFILYADKTKLSSFGTEKGYPVVARIAGLPVEIRNSDGFGGGRIVGWLPVIEEDPAETGKPNFVNHKRAVWHAAVEKVVEKVIEMAKTGCWFECADAIQRLLVPIILILSADWEEQTMMALTRGLNAKFPCPICLVPDDKLMDLEEVFTPRTSESMIQVFNEAQEMRTIKDLDAHLQSYGLRNVENVFWKMQGSDVYRALSFDRLHANHGGLFSDHLFVEVQRIFKELGKELAGLFDKQVQALPTWRGLNHFNAVIHTSFADGSKYEDISKIILFAIHNIFTERNTSTGYLLLQLIRSYLELDMYASLEVHTETTIAEGEVELVKFGNLLKEYSMKYPDKSWEFPKAHSQKHVFGDILAKGATRNYNTKTNEKCHGPLKTAYKLRTNFKKVAKQILEVDHCCLVAVVIRDKLNELDAHGKDNSLQSSSEEDEPDSLSSGSVHIYLGSQQKDQTFNEIELAYADDIAFNRFRIKLGIFFTNHFNRTREIKFKGTDAITEYQFLKVSYESMVDWQTQTDYLRRSPNFHGRQRNDYVLVNGVDKKFFAQLLLIFSCRVDDTEFKMAYIYPLDAPPGTIHRRRDRDLGFYRLRSRLRKDCMFISVESIIRGALIAKDYAKDGDYLVVDCVDADLWRRMKQLRKDSQI
ncbi:hypothetical protein Hypma_015251 [Hypsizygus marmoreus]|uniref:Uncharacterized protein n=1 Tax=Hypsizygus marmoreus TaxID=39966 RepID=A0A369KAP2_HYPMA|nr:hypothetical protein Hypma_015251 [Hypsizygus marmoreus]